MVYNNKNNMDRYNSDDSIPTWIASIGVPFEMVTSFISGISNSIRRDTGKTAAPVVRSSMGKNS